MVPPFQFHLLLSSIEILIIFLEGKKNAKRPASSKSPPVLCLNLLLLLVTLPWGDTSVTTAAPDTVALLKASGSEDSHRGGEALTNSRPLIRHLSKETRVRRTEHREHRTQPPLENTNPLFHTGLVEKQIQKKILEFESSAWRLYL